MSFTLTFGQEGNCATAQVVWSVDGKTYDFRSDNNFVAWISTIFTVADVVAGGGGSELVTSNQLPPVQGGVGNLWAEYGTAGSVVGNARGVGAVDWQQNRNLATEVASGLQSTVGGGGANTASGGGSTVGGGGLNNALDLGSTVAGGGLNTASGQYATVGGGQSNTASGQYATASGGRTNTASGSYATVMGGYQGLANRFVMVAHASGQFSAQGDAQAVEFVARNTTDDVSSSVLYLNGTSTVFGVQINSLLTGILTISGFSENGTKTAVYQRSVCIKNVGGTTTLTHLSTISTDHEDDPTWSVAITANNATDSLNISCLGSAGDTVRWVAVIRGLQILMP